MSQENTYGTIFRNNTGIPLSVFTENAQENIDLVIFDKSYSKYIMHGKHLGGHKIS